MHTRAPPPPLFPHHLPTIPSHFGAIHSKSPIRPSMQASTALPEKPNTCRSRTPALSAPCGGTDGLPRQPKARSGGRTVDLRSAGGIPPWRAEERSGSAAAIHIPETAVGDCYTQSPRPRLLNHDAVHHHRTGLLFDRQSMSGMGYGVSICRFLISAPGRGSHRHCPVSFASQSRQKKQRRRIAFETPTPRAGSFCSLGG